MDRKIGHKSVMFICQFFINRDEPDHLVDQAINDMEGITDASADWGNDMNNDKYTVVLQFLGDSCS